MKRNVLSVIFILLAIGFLSTVNTRLQAHTAEPDHGFSVKEYENFHDVLHPLEHEALPKNDFKTIRASAGELFGLGQAIIKLGVPRGVDEKYMGEFKEGLGKFREALDKFRMDAEGGTDEQLRESYSAVHDSFEMLAAMLPGK